MQFQRKWKAGRLMKATPKQQLGFLARDVLPLLEAIHAGYDYDPGDSDLSDEQPIWVRIPLGEYRRAFRLAHELREL
jgi:hypothetical protein